MTTLKDYKEKVLKEFREKFNRIVPSQGGFIVGEKSGRYDNCAFDLKDLESFLSLAIDNAVAEAFKAVEVEKKEITVIQVSSDGSKSEYMEPDVSFNDALQEIEDRKKQYLV